ncbi:hypothetical protein SAMN05216548_10489 [Faunimonas pinastri]|uniref:Uncharacterized protein n=1 Tax=Faunimonas pinastri TaxID=1855383 RepID=A0A1H9FDZ1_9HYPH|nr:hypothetical protein [Faunimonas pinastri]SEQ36156.1 hypothetical protein SAMN05216548_10489 [Faunimonas pinastri]
MSRDTREGSPISADFDVGDDSDLPGYDQPISADDIDAVLSGPEGSVEERRAVLTGMLDQLRTRGGMDESDEFGSLVSRVEDALATLESPAEDFGTPGGYGMDPDDRLDQPDEILERQEDYEAEERE